LKPYALTPHTGPGRPLVVALVEDDQLLREEVELHLKNHGFIVHAANSAAGLHDVMAQTAIDLFIVDWNLPGESGLSLSRRLRTSLPKAGIVMMTARVALHDRISGYNEGGADIYMTKPVAPDELVLVLKSLGRRLHPPAHTSQEWVMNLRDRTLQGPESEQKLRLTHREKALLVALVQAKENTLDSGMLCDLFDNGDTEETMTKHALEELVARLRKKFRAVQPEGAEPALKSVWGVGYQLCVPITFA
jgi:DNA-binding response OmpR family regulator